MAFLGRGRWLPIVLIAIGAGITRHAAAQVSGEAQVKAAYLLNFARFVDWPKGVLPALSPLRIAIIGDDALGADAEQMLLGKSVNSHPIQLRYQKWDDILTAYQIVFIGASEEAHLAQILRFLGPNSVLTVSDIDRFSLRGGVIEFRTVGNRVRFDINRTAADAAQLNISSKLFSVARAIQQGSGTH